MQKDWKMEQIDGNWTDWRIGRLEDYGLDCMVFSGFGGWVFWGWIGPPGGPFGSFWGGFLLFWHFDEAMTENVQTGTGN